MLATAGLEISAEKMSGWWTGTPNTVKLDDLDVICVVLNCEPSVNPGSGVERRVSAVGPFSRT